MIIWTMFTASIWVFAMAMMLVFPKHSLGWLDLNLGADLLWGIGMVVIAMIKA